MSSTHRTDGNGREQHADGSRCFRKRRRAQSRYDFETWAESGVANTLNAFDVGDVRSTTIVVTQIKQMCLLDRKTWKR